jgi:hypothetical protein
MLVANSIGNLAAYLRKPTTPKLLNGPRRKIERSLYEEKRRMEDFL